MKTFLAAALYTATVVALDVGGAVWQHFCVAHAAKAPVAAAAPATAAFQTGGPVRVAGTIPSDT